MRFDKLTTRFQQAFADAQSMAVGADHPTIEAPHLLLAMLSQEDSGVSALLSRAGVQVNALKADLQQAVDTLPKVAENNGEVTVSRDLNNLLNITDKLAQKSGDSYIASEMFLLALADDKGATGKLLKQHGLNKTVLEQAIKAVRGNDSVNSQEAEGQREALKK